jgi:hypothetical protein
MGIFGIYVFSFADGSTDPFYLRFASPRQSSLILGTSRAAQGIQPKILDEILESDKNHKFYNYAFTLGHSPYGPTYLQSIKTKINSKTNKGVFIVTVDPWAISSTKENPNDFSNFREKERILGKVTINNVSPNIQYLLFGFEGSYINILKNKYQNTALFLHKDGWLEVDVPMDSVSVNKRISQKIRNYRNINLPLFHFSELRLLYLEKTIMYLKEYGSVYLARLPVHPKMLEIEKSLMPDFDEKINQLVKSRKIPYLDMTNNNEQYEFIDGNHLYKTSGAEVSKKIAEWIMMMK